MTRRVLEKRCAKKVCVDFLPLQLGSLLGCADHLHLRTHDPATEQKIPQTPKEAKNQGALKGRT